MSQHLEQALAAKDIQAELHETLNLVIKVANFVKSIPLNERILRKLWEDSDAEHDALLFHTDVRWLSRGKTLERVYSIYDQLSEFIAEKHFFKAEEFSSIYFKLKLKSFSITLAILGYRETEYSFKRL